jgi:asparagine synthase (glutamine-hydrolysing)
VLLVHRRLAIGDPGPGGFQPMSTPEGRYHIVFNGGILAPRADLSAANAS